MITNAMILPDGSESVDLVISGPLPVLRGERNPLSCSLAPAGPPGPGVCAAEACEASPRGSARKSPQARARLAEEFARMLTSGEQWGTGIWNGHKVQ